MVDAPFETLNPDDFTTQALKRVRRELAETSSALNAQTTAILQRIKSEILTLNRDLETKQLNFNAQQEEAQRTHQNNLLQTQVNHDTTQLNQKAEFDRQQQAIAKQFETVRRNEQAKFNNQQQAKKEQFEETLLVKEQTFKAQLNDRNTTNNKAFDDARRKTKETQIIADAAPEDREVIAKEFDRQRRIEAAIEKGLKKVNLTNETLTSDQILKLAENLTGTTLKRDPKQIEGAINQIEAEQKRQQTQADQKARLEFEQQIRAEQSQFNQQQREETAIFNGQQQTQELEFKALQRSEELIFRASLQAADIELESTLRAEKAAFNIQQQAIAQAFAQSLQAEEAAFKTLQRSLDKQNAEQIVKILSKANQGAQEQKYGSGAPTEALQANSSKAGNNFKLIPIDEFAIDEFALPKTSSPDPKNLTLNTPELTSRLDTIIDENRNLAGQILTLANQPRTTVNNNNVTSTSPEPSILSRKRL